MAYLDELLSQQSQIIQQQQITSNEFLGLGNRAYAQYFPTWEVTAPQYQYPAAWSLSQLGYRKNEVAYACIDLWMKTISEPTLKIYDKTDDEEVDNDEFYRFMEQPCPDVSETDFWNATMMYLKIAGVMPWEKDISNDGSLINLWPMMPQYCSFMRGQGQLLRAIRYLPYTGLPAYDVPRERIVVFMYPDPQYYGLKPLSPTAVLGDIIGVDNDMTVMIQQFLRNGAFVSGLLSTDQIINEADARFAKERFKESHAGPNNAGDIVVVGKGMKFEPTSMTFREMVFPEVDARDEVRICMGYGVKPILVSAKVGMDRSTYNNYKEARQAWYEENVTSEWKFLAERATRDILPHFSTNPNHVCRFDVSTVKALQEDRNAAWKRAIEAYKARIIVRNDALNEMGMDPLEDEETGNEYYSTAMEQYSLSEENNLDVPNAEEPQGGIQDKLKVVGPDRVKVDEDKAEEEEKKFRAMAKRRLKEGKPNDIGEFEFKYVDEQRRRQLLSEFGVPDPDAEMVLKALLKTIETLTIVPSVNVASPTVNVEAPTVNIENKMPKLDQLEFKSSPVINVEVSPTPVTIENSVTVEPAQIDMRYPKKKTEVQRVIRDGMNNITGTITEAEYEDE